MWCRVQECRGPNGERLKRKDWPPTVDGELTIILADQGWVAHLDRPDVGDREYQVLMPLGDVRVQTYGDGLLVLGYRIVPGQPIRDVRQAWFCLPSTRPAGASLSGQR